MLDLSQVQNVIPTHSTLTSHTNTTPIQRQPPSPNKATFWLAQNVAEMRSCPPSPKKRIPILSLAQPYPLHPFLTFKITPSPNAVHRRPLSTLTEPMLPHHSRWTWHWPSPQHDYPHPPHQCLGIAPSPPPCCLQLGQTPT
ncbi:hypothetical protein PIB30_054840 [Stylosanthes scabra]|uniref:Uncharacterized protein n=1 Tax=Stylosanthes scabra TaxID=79078 RepID=A0ABU6RIT8_9FABA|nr:hypothetical protein [Stylosanthes scabra]